MTQGPAYPPARAVAARVHQHFARQIAAARAQGQEDLAREPDTATIEAVIDAAFWASLRREEVYVPRLSLALLEPGEVRRPLTFERPLPFTAPHIARMAPAVEGPAVHLGVARGAYGLHVWGTTRTLPTYCFVLEVAAPGLLVVKHARPEESGKYVNVAVLKGDQVKVLEERPTHLSDYPSFLTALLGVDPPATRGSVNVLALLAVAMRAHGRGGSLLLVPGGSGAWRESIQPHIPYPVEPPYAELAELMRADAGKRRRWHWRESLREAVQAVAGLTAVDGATVMSQQYDVLAFGAKMVRRDGWPPVPRVVVAEPVEGGVAASLHPSELGGTRHQSAAQFVHDQRDAMALVASQDGRFTSLGWSAMDEAVHAYRVETLLL
ncbi:MAG TPA: hypothetical protein VII13_01885 [Vicinamibacteria bacterium]